MTERELKAAAVGIITYCSLCQTGQAPKLDEESQMIENAAFLDNNMFESALEICSVANLDGLELSYVGDEE